MPALALLALLALDGAGPPPLTFERDVRPILKEHCFHCHGEAERPGAGSTSGWSGR